jgi:hypothetical protein
MRTFWLVWRYVTLTMAYACAGIAVWDGVSGKWAYMGIQLLIAAINAANSEFCRRMNQRAVTS